MKDSHKMLTGYFIGGLLVLVIFPSIIYLVIYTEEKVI